MTTRVRVSLGHEGSDRPQWVSVGAAALGGLTCGLLLMLALGRSLGAGGDTANGNAPNGNAPNGNAPNGNAPSTSGKPPERTTAVSAAATAGAAQPPNAGATATRPQLEPPPAAQPQPEPATTVAIPSAAPEPPPIEPPPAEPPPASATSTSHQFVRGQIAYLRCEGVPLESGPFPCPRDRRFEKQVWAALERLQQCPLPVSAPSSGSNGDVELRIEFRTRGRRSFEVLPAGGSEALAAAAHACLAGDLELVRTQLRPISMTVAFRFELH